MYKNKQNIFVVDFKIINKKRTADGDTREIIYV